MSILSKLRLAGEREGFDEDGILVIYRLTAEGIAVSAHANNFEKSRVVSYLNLASCSDEYDVLLQAHKDTVEELRHAIAG
jgi:hypothetical protein